MVLLMYLILPHLREVNANQVSRRIKWVGHEYAWSRLNVLCWSFLHRWYKNSDKYGNKKYYCCGSLFSTFGKWMLIK